MADLLVEDGSEVTSANSYISLDDADTYFENRGNTAWDAASDTAKEEALLRACDYLDTLNWKGYKAEYENSLEWPRESVDDRNGYAVGNDEIPQKVINAQCEAALLELTAGTLTPTLDKDDRIRSEKVDVIETSYFDDAREKSKFTIIDNLLKGFVESGGSLEIVRS